MIQVHPLDADFATKARIDQPTYARLYAESVRDPDGVLATHRQAPRLDHALQQGQGRLVRRGRSPHPLVRTTASSMSRRTASTGTSHGAATRPRSSGKATIPAHSRRISYRELHAEVCRCANLLKNLGVAQGRSRLHLPADDSGSRDRDARVHAHRRGAFGGVRRLLAGFARRPHRRFDMQARHHRRRRPARRQDGSAEDERRRSADTARHEQRRDRHRGQAHGRRDRDAAAARSLVARADGRASGPNARRRR